MTRRFWLGCLVAVSLCAQPSVAHAEPAAAIANGNLLRVFDTTTPGTTTTRAITGLGPNESVRGIDVRPSTGQVYIGAVTAGSASNSTIRTYTLNVATARATPVGTSAAIAGAGDLVGGWDFNPVSDRIRYVNGEPNHENARLNPDTGVLAGKDTDLLPAATTDVVGAAYDRNRGGATVTTLYAINRDSSSLVVVGGIDGASNPNLGVVTSIGSLQVTLHPTIDAGFDISPTGIAYATLAAADSFTRLYTINLVTGAATPVGFLGTGDQTHSLAILDADIDGDGLIDRADNCVAAANADQANLDGDEEGDTCDADDDGDLVPDVVEATLGSNPRVTDSDGDGKTDNADSCPTIAASTATGCPDLATPSPTPTPSPPVLVPTPIAPVPLRFTISGLASRAALTTLRSRGLTFTVAPSEAAAFTVELRGRLRGARIARAGDLVLGEGTLARAAGARRITVRVARAQRSRLRRRGRIDVRVTATDALGRSVVVTRRVTIR